jgi:hypothetical protein
VVSSSPLSSTHDSDNKRIMQLLEEYGLPVEAAPYPYQIGDGGVSLKKKIGNEHDRARRKNCLMELRKAVIAKIKSYKSRSQNNQHLLLLENLEETINTSNDALIWTAKEIVGVRPSEGLFEKIALVLKQAKKLS